MITGTQVREARNLLGWAQWRLARASKTTIRILVKIEADALEGVNPARRDSVQAALEAAGCIFIAENGEGPGVRLRKARSDG